MRLPGALRAREGGTTASPGRRRCRLRCRDARACARPARRRRGREIERSRIGRCIARGQGGGGVQALLNGPARKALVSLVTAIADAYTHADAVNLAVMRDGQRRGHSATRAAAHAASSRGRGSTLPTCRHQPAAPLVLCHSAGCESWGLEPPVESEVGHRGRRARYDSLLTRAPRMPISSSWRP